MASEQSLAAISGQIAAALAVPLPGSGVPVDVHRAPARGATQIDPPYGQVVLLPVTSEQGPVMGQYTRSLSYRVDIWTAAPGDADARMVLAEELLDESLKVLEDARRANGSPLFRAHTFVVSSALAEELPDPGIAHVQMQIDLTYRRQRGVSGVET